MEWDPAEAPVEEEPLRFAVKEKCANHHACECNAKKLADAETFAALTGKAQETRHAAYEQAAALLIDLYRKFPRLRRHEVSAKLRELYERLKDVGVSVGISRISMSGIGEG